MTSAVALKQSQPKVAQTDDTVLPEHRELAERIIMDRAKYHFTNVCKPDKSNPGFQREVNFLCEVFSGDQVMHSNKVESFANSLIDCGWTQNDVDRFATLTGHTLKWKGKYSTIVMT